MSFGLNRDEHGPLSTHAFIRGPASIYVMVWWWPWIWDCLVLTACAEWKWAFNGIRDSHIEWSKSERERQIPYDITYIWNLIYGTDEPFHRKEIHGLGKQTCGCQGEWGRSGRNWEFGVNRCKLLLLEWKSNEILLCSTGNYVWSLVMEHDTVRKMNAYMYVWLGHLAVQ